MVEKEALRFDLTRKVDIDSVMTFEIVDGDIQSIDSVGNPDKLERISHTIKTSQKPDILSRES